MPKSNVYSYDPTGGSRGPERQRRVSVGWGRDRGYMQIGVGWIVPPEAADSVDLPDTDEHGRVWDSQWCDMDRHGINQLIRELRHARDEAFGRNE